MHMVFQVYICNNKKIIPYRDCSNTWAVSKFVSKIAFLYKLYREKLLFPLNLDLILRTREIEKLINDTYIGIVSILVRKKCGITVEIFKRGYLKLWKCLKWEDVPKIRVKCFISLTKVYIINFNHDYTITVNNNHFNYDYNIIHMHQF